MAREILFKAKRLDNGEWVEGYLFFIVDTPYIICDGETMCMDGENTDLYATEWYEVDEKTISQYTGLIDKNGNKIWEGDVYEYWGPKERFVVRYGTYTHSNTEFKNTNIGFYADWQIETTMRKDLLFWVKNRDINLIGNIFENPELLEGGVDNAG